MPVYHRRRGFCCGRVLRHFNVYGPSSLQSSRAKLGNELLGDGLYVPGAVFSGAADAKNDVPCTGVDVFLQPLNALFYRAQ